MGTEMLIDPKSPIPVYKQIATQLRQRIAKRIYQPGESLPSLRVLAAEVGVNPNTVQRAYEELTREGLVESRRGAGLFVTYALDAPLGRTERRLEQALDRAVLRAVSDGLAPERIRTMFQEVLNRRIEQALREGR